MTAKMDAVLYTLLGVARAHKKPYCFPSQDHIRYLVAKYQKVKMCPRTLNRVLKDLELEGYIERIRRHREGMGGKMVFGSTLYKFKGKVFKWLVGALNRIHQVFSFFRLPKWAVYKPLKSEIYSGGWVFGGKLDKNLMERGRASPPQGIL